MVILGEVLVAGGSALVVCSAIFWAWNRSSCGDRMRLWTNRRKPRDDEKPGHGSDRRGSNRIPSAPLACNPPGGSKQANLTNRHTGRPSSRRGIYCFGPGGQMIILASFAWLMWGGSRCGSPRNLFYSCR